MIADIARTYPESYCLVERPHQELAARQHTVEIHEPPGEDSRLPEIAQGCDRRHCLYLGPRPLFKVERLPRNPTGKLPRAELLGLLARLRAGT